MCRLKQTCVVVGTGCLGGGKVLDSRPVRLLTCLISARGLELCMNISFDDRRPVRRLKVNLACGLTNTRAKAEDAKVV